MAVRYDSSREGAPATGVNLVGLEPFGVTTATSEWIRLEPAFILIDVATAFDAAEEAGDAPQACYV